MQSHLISTTNLNERQHQNETNLVIIDVRFSLAEPEKGHELYLLSHIPGAYYLDLNKHLSGTKSEHGGRHPLPAKETFMESLQGLGIGNQSSIVVYDEDGMTAPRLWWLLQMIGLADVKILDGGWTKWVKEEREVEGKIPESSETNFQVDTNSAFHVVNYEYVVDKIEKKDTVIIDSREPSRYQGLHEPIDAKAGHIPTAKNYFWKDVFKTDGTLKSKQELTDHFKGIGHEQEIIVYCGSGVSACPNIVALKELGYQNVSLYAGSWSDWISYENSPIAVGKS